MKSERIDFEEKISVYPCLKEHFISVNDRFIVLFTAPKTGTVVWKTNNAAWDIGYYSKDWAENAFDLTESIITLSN